jgi:hypothetical protein
MVVLAYSVAGVVGLDHCHQPMAKIDVVGQRACHGGRGGLHERQPGPHQAARGDQGAGGRSLTQPGVAGPADGRSKPDQACRRVLTDTCLTADDRLFDPDRREGRSPPCADASTS